MNNRRKFMTVAATAMLLPVSAIAQQNKPARIGVLGSSPGPHWDTFTQELRRLGYEPGKNIEFDFRWVEGRNERLAIFAAELVNRKVAVIVTEGTLAAVTAKKNTNTIPIDMAISADPVGAGLVSSLARPDGNVTGSSSLAPNLIAKQIELLREIIPGLTRLAILNNPDHPLAKLAHAQAETAARALRVQLVPLSTRGRADYYEAFQNAVKGHAGAMLILADPTFDTEQSFLAEFALKNKLPTLYNKTAFADAGGLIAYGARYSEFFARAAIFVNKILKGAKPSDLPIEQATNFELVVNMNTAKALGLKIPQAILVRADKVIE